MKLGKIWLIFHYNLNWNQAHKSLEELGIVAGPIILSQCKWERSDSRAVRQDVVHDVIDGKTGVNNTEAFQLVTPPQEWL